MQILESQRQELMAAALAARASAYAPYSQFAVGAAVLDASGRIFQGCNVENVSFGLTICAERVAATSAIAAGSRDLAACAVCTPGGGTPCGACRQFLAEFNSQMKILLVDADQPGVWRECDLAKLLPDQFRL
ncbi:MAG: cytidine deaminase [Planctomycetales bacterium]|nr:cytidine deaminase [Planctomycetales bacterium]